MSINHTAIVDPGAVIHEDVEIGPHTIIEANVEISKGCKIASSVLIASGARLAEGVVVHHGAVIGTVPQDLKFDGEETLVEIGSNTVVREYATINRGTVASGKTSVGSNCLLMAYSHVAHDCVLGNNVIMSNAVNMAGHVHINDFAIISGIVAIHQFVNIGEHCMIGGLFRVPKDVPPYILAGGHPLRYEGLNSVGLKRRGFTPEQRNALKEAYRMIYQSDMLRTDALAELKANPGIPEVIKVVEFFENSQRGVI